MRLPNFTRFRIAVPVMFVALAASCSQQGGNGKPLTAVTASTGRPSVGVSLSPAPTQINTGRQTVRYDPCVQLGDGVIADAGFDPPSRKRDDSIHDNYSFIGCSFDHKQLIDRQSLTTRTLTVWSTNITLEEFRQRDGAKVHPITINGRDGLTTYDAPAAACAVELPGPDSTLYIGTSTSAPFTDERPCDRIETVATIIDAAVEKH